MVYKRDNTDVMNNFFVNIIARSFTDIEEFLIQQEENKSKDKQASALKELDSVKEEWKSSIIHEAAEQLNQLDNKIMSMIGKRDY